VTVSCLNKEARYHYRIGAYNDSGVAAGTVTATAQ
jgi:hypothetical protein